MLRRIYLNVESSKRSAADCDGFGISRWTWKEQCVVAIAVHMKHRGVEEPSQLAVQLPLAAHPSANVLTSTVEKLGH